MKTTRTWKVTKFRDNERSEFKDVVAEESRLRILVNGSEVLSLYCTPSLIRELVVGLLMTEDMADDICTERMSILYGDEVVVDVPAEGEVRREGATVTSGCVGGMTFKKKSSDEALKDPFKVKRGDARDLFEKFHGRSGLYGETGCIHSAALSDGCEIVAFAEDIGRHNAVDKVIGAAILDSLGFSGMMMLVSGRLSSEIVSKCARWGIPMVVSRSAPTALALDIAEKSGVTVIGFMRGKRFNVYTHPKRVL